MSTRYSNGPQQGNGFCGYIVGQHVVYINDDGHEARKQKYPHVAHLFSFPTLGKVYTVRQVFIEPTYNIPVVHLAEIVNAPFNWPCGFYEPGFAASRFRPLQKLTPEMFMSTGAPVKQGAPA